MKKIWIITKRELNSYLNSLMAYIMMVLFLGLCGFFTWIFGIGGGDVFMSKEASLDAFFGIAYWALFFFIPALTMKLIAEEKKTGTIELLLTKAVTDFQVIMGKFLATLLLITVALILTLPYYVTVWKLGPIDHGAVWTGYLGLVLMSAGYISIGIFASSITDNQIISFLLALFICFFFQLIFQIMAGYLTGFAASLFEYLSLKSHYDSISRGVIDSKDIVYFLSLTFVGLFASEVVLAKRNVVD